MMDFGSFLGSYRTIQEQAKKKKFLIFERIQYSERPRAGN